MKLKRTVDKERITLYGQVAESGRLRAAVDRKSYKPRWFKSIPAHQIKEISMCDVTCKNGEIIFVDDPYCDHCGHLQPYDMILVESEWGSEWCQCCAEANGEIDDVDTDWIEATEKEHKIRYHRKQLATLLGE
jgi:hypothetical protein